MFLLKLPAYLVFYWMRIIEVSRNSHKCSVRLLPLEQKCCVALSAVPRRLRCLPQHECCVRVRCSLWSSYSVFSVCGPDFLASPFDAHYSGLDSGRFFSSSDVSGQELSDIWTWAGHWAILFIVMKNARKVFSSSFSWPRNLVNFLVTRYTWLLSVHFQG